MVLIFPSCSAEINLWQVLILSSLLIRTCPCISLSSWGKTWYLSQRTDFFSKESFRPQYKHRLGPRLPSRNYPVFSKRALLFDNPRFASGALCADRAHDASKASEFQGQKHQHQISKRADHSGPNDSGASEIMQAHADINGPSVDEKNDVQNDVLPMGNKERLARAAAALIAKREEKENDVGHSHFSMFPASYNKSTDNKSIKSTSPTLMQGRSFVDNKQGDPTPSDLSQLTKKIDQKILGAKWSRSSQRQKLNDKSSGAQGHVQHSTDSMQSLLGFNHFEGDWSDRNSTIYHVAIVFGKALIRDQVTLEYAARIRTLAKLLMEESSFRPSLICFTGGKSTGNTVSDASAGYTFFRHLCASQSIPIDNMEADMWVDTKSDNEREAMECIASELWGTYIKKWLSERPFTERLNRHYGVEWTILERKIEIHFTLISTEYHLCNLNDIHHRSPGKSFLQPLVSLRGLVGSERWNTDEQEILKSSPFSGRSDNVQANFGGIQHSVDTSWSFQYGTYPFLHGKDESAVFLGQCYLLGEELTPLLVNMKGVVEQTEFFQRDNYLLLSSIRRSLVSLVEALYTEKGQTIRSGVIKYFESQRNNKLTKEDVKIIVILESALLNLGRCIDLVKPAGLLVSSVPASTWSKALDALKKSMNSIQTVCDPDQPLEPAQWGKLTGFEGDGEDVVHSKGNF